jgi:hypothetical protein
VNADGKPIHIVEQTLNSALVKRSTSHSEFGQRNMGLTVYFAPQIMVKPVFPCTLVFVGVAV